MNPPSLDNERKSEVLPFIFTLPKEFSVPILYVSHSVDGIVNLADYLVIVDSGRAMLAGQMKNMDRFDLWSSAWCGPLPDRGIASRPVLALKSSCLAHLPNDLRPRK
jgi:energy-coupling factor transporter ATP-binding protein EcfA2